MKRITPEERARRLAIVRRDYPTMSGRKIDRREGWKTNTTYAIARQYGIDHVPGFFRDVMLKTRAVYMQNVTAERARRLAIVRRDFPHMPGLQLDQREGWKRGYASYLALQYGIVHTPECIARINKTKNANRLHISHENVLRAAARRRVRMKVDRLRYLCGEKTRYNYNYGKLPGATYRARFALIKYYNYIPDESDQFLFYYDARTNRRSGRCARGSEAYYAQKYHFRFLPLPADESEETAESDYEVKDNEATQQRPCP